MRVILTNDMANELYHNEEMIKNQEGPYRPQFNVVTRKFEPVIKCFPFEPCDGTNIREREVTTGMENEVADIAMGIIDNGKISFKSNHGWENNREMKKYSILIYEPKFVKPVYFLTSDILPDLFAQLKTYNIGKKDDTSSITQMNEGVGMLLDRMFGLYVMGICTYIFFEGDHISRCGKWTSKLGY